MVKKIAAPRKAARKVPARKKASAKKVTAPKTIKPKGSPKEKLSYLNKEEMAALVKRKGSPARRGPKGIPSFADDSASSKGVSRGDSSGTKGSGSTKTSNGSVSNSSGGGSSPSRSSSSPSGGGGLGQGGQNSGAGRDSSRGLGQGAGGAAIGRGYNSGTSGSRYGGASTQKPGMGRNEGQVGPRSPMGGQGSSFKSPQAARDYNRTTGMGIEDNRRFNGPIREVEEDAYYERQLNDLEKSISASERGIAALGVGKTRNGGEYSARVARSLGQMKDARTKYNESAERTNKIKNDNLDRSQMPSRDARAVSKGAMDHIGNERLPSRGGGATSFRSVAGGKESRRFRSGGVVRKTFKKK